MPADSSASSAQAAWQAWSDRCVALIGPQHRSLDHVLRAMELARSLPSPAPARVSWAHRLQMSDERPGILSGPPMEMLLSVGDVGLYASGAKSSEGAGRPILEALIELGRLLMSKGAELSGSVPQAALRRGLRNLDGFERLLACDAWGALDSAALDGRRALALCAPRGEWDKEAGKACWELLVRRGAALGAELWTRGPQDEQPALAALKARDWAAFARAARDGVSLGWADPASGATLWHLAAVGGPAMGKACLGLLAERARGLVDAPTRAKEDFGERGWLVGEGQTPLHCAARDVEPAAVSSLLSLGADPGARDARGDTPLLALARKSGAKARAKAAPVVRALLDAGADPGARDAQGLTAAQIMAAKGPLGALEPLLALRPQDVGGDEPRQRGAFERLAARGAQELSLAERVAFEAAGGPATPKAPKAPPKSL